MRKTSLLKIGVMGVLALGVVACSSTKPKGPEGAAQGAAGAYANGTAGGAAFGESSSVRDMCAKYNPNGSAHYYFDFDSDSIQGGDSDSLKAQANDFIAKGSKVSIRVEGNTDERGSKEYNIALGWKRAKAIASDLQMNGIAVKQISIVSYGEEKPIAMGHDEDSWQCNRRVDIFFEGK